MALGIPAFNIPAQAAGTVTFDGSPGTAAPPPTLGQYTMTPFPADPQAELSVVPSVAAPTGGDVSFAPALNHRIVGSSWASWSHGYTGDVYSTDGGTSVVLTMPPSTAAFYFYAEPNPFAPFDITALADNGTTSGPISVDGSGGAKYFGFYATGTTIVSITVSSIVDFAVGEFGIAVPPTVVPTANTAVEGNSNNVFPFSCGSISIVPSQRYQQVYDGTAVGSGLITQLAFRPDSGFGAAFGPTTIPGVTITLSTTTAAVGALSMTFADNVGADVVTVHSGDLTLESANTGGPPRDFDVAIPLQTPFAFNSTLGNLLLDVTVPTCVETTALDAEESDPETGRTGTFLVGDSTSPTADFQDVYGLVTQFTLGPLPPHDTAVTIDGVLAATYSDPLTLEGNLQDTTTAGPLAGATLDFTVGPTLLPAQTQASDALTDASGDAQASFAQLFQTPGAFSVGTGVSFTATTIGGQPYNGSTDSSGILLVNKEDCTVAYTGDTLVAPGANTNLKAQLGESDLTPGDWLGKSIRFRLTSSSAVVTDYFASTNILGVASLNQAIPQDVYGVVVSFAGDDYYNGCTSPAAPNDTLLTVQAAGAKATGGGYFSNPDRTSFGFNVVPQAGGFKGQFQLRSNNGKKMFHGNTATGVTKPANNSVKWSGTGKWLGVAGYTYEITVVDNGTSGKKGDTINIKIKLTASPFTVVYNTTTAVALKGGNIVVGK